MTDAVPYKADVEVSLLELLDYGKNYEHFLDLLADKVFEAYEAEMKQVALPISIDPHEVMVCGEYAISGYVPPNSVTISVEWVVDR